jgi:hypothetical protein
MWGIHTSRLDCAGVGDDNAACGATGTSDISYTLVFEKIGTRTALFSSKSRSKGKICLATRCQCARSDVGEMRDTDTGEVAGRTRLLGTCKETRGNAGRGGRLSDYSACNRKKGDETGSNHDI